MVPFHTAFRQKAGKDDPLAAIEGKRIRQQQNRDCIGGLVNPIWSLEKVSGGKTLGPRLRKCVDKVVDANFGDLSKRLDTLGQKSEAEPPPQYHDQLRAALSEEFGAYLPVGDGLCGEPFELIVSLSGDPEIEVLKWHKGIHPFGCRK